MINNNNNNDNDINTTLTNLLQGISYTDEILKLQGGQYLKQRFYIKKATIQFDNSNSYILDEHMTPILLNVVSFTDMDEPIYLTDVIHIDNKLLSHVSKLKRGQVKLEFNKQINVYVVKEKDIGTVCLENI